MIEDYTWVATWPTNHNIAELPNLELSNVQLANVELANVELPSNLKIDYIVFDNFISKI